MPAMNVLIKFSWMGNKKRSLTCDGMGSLESVTMHMYLSQPYIVYFSKDYKVKSVT